LVYGIHIYSIQPEENNLTLEKAHCYSTLPILENIDHVDTARTIKSVTRGGRAKPAGAGAVLQNAQRRCMCRSDGRESMRPASSVGAGDAASQQRFMLFIYLWELG